MDLYFTENQRLGGGHPITKGASNFHLDDEIYYDMDISPGGRACWRRATRRMCRRARKPPEGGKANIYDIQPQMWTYEKGHAAIARSSASPGISTRTFELPNYRAILLRGIAWAGKRDEPR